MSPPRKIGETIRVVELTPSYSMELDDKGQWRMYKTFIGRHGSYKTRLYEVPNDVCNAIGKNLKLGSFNEASLKRD